MENTCKDKSIAFAVRIVNLRKFLIQKYKEHTLSNQVLRSGTSIGANVSEAQKAQSKADFYSKMCIALKEANETQYWLTLLYKTHYISKTQFESINADADELICMLTAICKTADSKK